METKKPITESKSMNQTSYTFSFESNKTPKAIFKTLLDVKKWWVGFHEETILGSSKELNDIFSFKAGSGMHYTIQKLVELIPNKRMAWLVTESNLSYLESPSEWEQTRICFDISQEQNKTKITFTHEGLVPDIECYNACTNSWSNYLNVLKNKLS